MKAARLLYIVMAAGISLCFKHPPGVVMNPCLKEVKEIYDQMYTRLPEEGKVYHFGYRIVSTLNAKDKSGRPIVSQSDIDLFSSKNQYRFTSKDISVYQDQDNKFTVLPSRKIIYWGDSDMGLLKGNRLDKLKKIQDTIFSYADVVNCQQVHQGSIDKLITVKLQKKFADYMQIKQVTYGLDSRNKQLKRLRIEYPETKDVLVLEFIFNESDYDYKKMAMTPVKTLFVEGSNLNSLYKNYKLIDVRKKN